MFQTAGGFSAFKDYCLRKDFWLGLGIICLAMVVAITVNILLFIQYHTYYTAAKHIQLNRDHFNQSTSGNETAEPSVDAISYELSSIKPF